MKNKLTKTTLLLAIPTFGLSLISCNHTGYKIGIMKYETHEALNLSVKGFKDVLNELNLIEKYQITFDEQNPEGQASSLTTMSNKLVMDSDVIYAVATPVATSIKNAVEEAGKRTPILFSAVTDPLDAKLVKSLEKPGENVSGVSDQNPVKESIKLLQSFAKEKMHVALLYTSSEKNSLVQIEQAKTAIEEFDWTYVTKAITSSNEILSVINSLRGENVDAIYIPTDNTIAKSLEIIKNALGEFDKKPIIVVGDSNMLNSGGILSLGVDYLNLGRMAGYMAAKIITKEANVGDLPVQYATSFPLKINKSLADEWGIEIPQELLERSEGTI